MAKNNSASTSIGQQVEYNIAQLDGLSAYPSTATKIISHFVRSEPSNLADIIESDPALTSKMLTLIHQQGVSLSDENFSIRQAIDKVPPNLIHDALFSVKAFWAVHDQSRSLPRKQLLIHSIAVGICARAIAEIISPKMNSNLAYLAGLLHDIGKLALDQAMPKSFIRITEEAASESCSSCAIEQKHLGTDHAIIGKRLAEKWHLPNQIVLAIWLHHLNTTKISETMPEARIAQIVQLADITARTCQIGQSGSYDTPDPDLAKAITRSLAIDPEHLQQIRQNLADAVAKRSNILGLNLPNAVASYCDNIASAACQMAKQITEISIKDAKLHSSASHFDFMTDFFSSINFASSAIEIAENFAVSWQKFYQTGPVCVYLISNGRSQTLEAAVARNLSQSSMVLLNAPSDTTPIPQAAAKDFKVFDIDDSTEWLFEQLDVDFDRSRTKLLPLLGKDKAIGAIVFELRHPGRIEALQDKLKAITSMVGAILDIAIGMKNQQHYAEQFARMITEPAEKEIKTKSKPEPVVEKKTDEIISDGSLTAFAEIAAGAAHELNNPLSVISGRAQLLAESETDPEKKYSLTQIQKNSGELAFIIDDLMGFANPPDPRRQQTGIGQIIDEALQLAAQKTGIESVNAEVEMDPKAENVFVDSAQIVSAVANIISNSVESRSNDDEPIKISTRIDTSNSNLVLAITDTGCGMDQETVQKATYPFFSAKPAGRKRGMGLAYANRMIQLNGGSLNIKSKPGEGTTVTVTLPCR